MSYPPPLPPRTEEATQLVDENEEKEREYINARPQKSPAKPKPAVNGRKATVDAKPDVGIKPQMSPKPNTNPFKEDKMSKPHFVATQPLNPTPVQKPSTNPFLSGNGQTKAPIVNIGKEGYMNVGPSRLNKTTPPNVSVVNVSGNSSEVVQTNRDSTLENYGAISDWISGKPTKEGSPKQTHNSTNENSDDYSLVKNPVYDDNRDSIRSQKKLSQSDSIEEPVHMTFGAVDNRPNEASLSSVGDYSAICDWTSGDAAAEANSAPNTEPYALASATEPNQKHPLTQSLSGVSSSSSQAYEYVDEKPMKSKSVVERTRSQGQVYEYVSGKPAGKSSAPVLPPGFNPYEACNTEEYALAQDTSSSYAYAGENAENKWSLQHVALRREPPVYPPPPPSSAGPKSRGARVDEAYEDVSIDRKLIDRKIDRKIM